MKKQAFWYLSEFATYLVQNLNMESTKWDISQGNNKFCFRSSIEILHARNILWDHSVFHFTSLLLNNSNFQSTWKNSLLLYILFTSIPWLFHLDQGLVATGWSTRTYWNYFSLCLSITHVPSFLEKLLIFIEIKNFEVISCERLLANALYSRLDVHYQALWGKEKEGACAPQSFPKMGPFFRRAL